MYVNNTIIIIILLLYFVEFTFVSCCLHADGCDCLKLEMYPPYLRTPGSTYKKKRINNTQTHRSNLGVCFPGLFIVRNVGKYGQFHTAV